MLLNCSIDGNVRWESPRCRGESCSHMVHIRFYRIRCATRFSRQFNVRTRTRIEWDAFIKEKISSFYLAQNARHWNDIIQFIPKCQGWRRDHRIHGKFDIFSRFTTFEFGPLTEQNETFLAYCLCKYLLRNMITVCVYNKHSATQYNFMGSGCEHWNRMKEADAIVLPQRICIFVFNLNISTKWRMEMRI